MSAHAPEITVIGGGTGSFTLLNVLKEFTPNISAVVNMSDDGGSTGILRDEYGVLPPGDIRQCLVALSDLPEARDMFNYRFASGPFKNHALGNIILSGCELMYDDCIEKSVRLASSLLQTKGSVIPVTTQKHGLILRDGDKTITGEHLIGEHRLDNPAEASVLLDPPSAINPRAVQAIEQSDLVVLAPGNLFGSLLPTLAVGGMAKAIANSKAKTVLVTNLVTKPGQTDGWHIADYVKIFERYIGSGRLDKVLYNSEKPAPELLSKYAAQGEHPVGTDPARFSEFNAEPIGAPLVAQNVYAQDENDTLIQRTLIRHDGYQVGKQLMRMFYE